MGETRKAIELTVDKEIFRMSKGTFIDFHLKVLCPTTIEIYGGLKNTYKLTGDSEILKATKIIIYGGYRNSNPTNIPPGNIEKHGCVY